jgi:hypothetical protein
MGKAPADDDLAKEAANNKVGERAEKTGEA